MTSKLAHVALNTAHMEEAVEFFHTVFGMVTEKATGEAPNRQIWLSQGIQLNEATESISAVNTVDHIAIYVDDIAEVIAAVKHRNFVLVEGKDNWFRLPSGVLIELLEEPQHT